MIVHSCASTEPASEYIRPEMYARTHLDPIVKLYPKAAVVIRRNHNTASCTVASRWYRLNCTAHANIMLRNKHTKTHPLHQLQKTETRAVQTQTSTLPNIEVTLAHHKAHHTRLQQIQHIILP